jgi:hypothetical protein
LTVPDISPWEIKDGSQYPFVCEMDITYKVIQIASDSKFYGPVGMPIKSPNYTYLDFPSTALPALKPFPLPNEPKTPTIDIKPVGLVNPLNSPTRQLFKANLAASKTQNDLTQTANAEKYLADTANVNSSTPLIPNTAITSNVSNSTTSTPPQNFGKQPEYDSLTGDYKRNIFGQIKLFKARGVDANQN